MEYEVLKCIVSVPIGSTAPISLWESIPSLPLIITLPLTKKHIRQSDTLRLTEQYDTSQLFCRLISWVEYNLEKSLPVCPTLQLVIITMVTLLLLTPLVLELATACNILGFKYVPPADSKSSVTGTSSASQGTRQSCVPCTRSGLGGTPSPRFGWPPPATTPATSTTTTQAPCCAGSLKNATG